MKKQFKTGDKVIIKSYKLLCKVAVKETGKSFGHGIEFADGLVFLDEMKEYCEREFIISEKFPGEDRFLLRDQDTGEPLDYFFSSICFETSKLRAAVRITKKNN